MTPNINKSLSAIFDVELTSTDKPLEELKIDAKNKSIDSLEAQREYVKANIVELIEKGKTVLDNMSTIANSTEDAKDFTVVTNLIKTLVETNMTLLDCEVAHKPKLELLEAGQEAKQITNNTTVFCGSTSDLAKMVTAQQTLTIENKND